MKKPEPKHYGYEDGGIETPTGWSMEGGEEAYHDALKKYNEFQEILKLAFEFMEKDEYTQGFPDDWDGCIYILAQFGSYIKSINVKG